MGFILYADDIALLAGFCYGLQKMLDICTQYGYRWGITFNTSKSQLLTLWGRNPPVSLTLANKPLVWYYSVIYLGIQLVSGIYFKMDLTSAKLKYYGCFNSILSVTGKQQNEIVCLNLISTYCLPKLIYGCEIISDSSVNIHHLEVVWNNAFCHIFNCCWRGSVKALQYFCHSLPLSLYHIDERRLMFFYKTSVS